MELRFTKFPDDLHRLAKMVAAHRGVTLNKFILDATRAAILRAGHDDKQLRSLIDQATGLEQGK